MTVDIGALVAHRLRDVPDFPKPGIVFKDVSPLYADAMMMEIVVNAITDPMYEDEVDIDLVAGIEARGFVLAAAVAAQLEAGVVMVRKAGKLPPPTIGRAYELEYGTAELEIPVHIVDGMSVLIVDDVLATGGTMRAAADLIAEAGGTVAGIAVLLELGFLNGRSALGGLPELRALLTV